MRYVTVSGSVATIKVDGRYDLCCTQEVQAELEQAYLNGCTKVVVDFADTTYFDSSVMRDLSKVRRRIRPENFSARNAKGKVLEMLKMAKLDSWLTDL